MRTLTSLSTQNQITGRQRKRATIRRRIFLAFICLLIILLTPSDGYLGPARSTLIISQAIDNQGFRLAAWETQALTQKARDLITRPGNGLTPQQQHDLVVSYFATTGQINDLIHQIDLIYANPQQTDPQAAAAPLQAQLDSLRAAQAERRPTVERILEQQVTAVLRAEGLTTAGRVWPPVCFRFTASPDYLIISPRERIFVKWGIYLNPALSLAQMDRIETQVERGLDVSALVEGTGGFSSYPTMVIGDANMEWTLSTIAHEWGHTYLFFRPLGWHYFDSGDTRTLNETTVSILGDEIARKVLEHYYPEKVPPTEWPRPLSMNPDWWGPRPKKPHFEFGPFMRKTRLHVDDLLTAGKIEAAEAYMESQRQVLVAHGYAIRKLNQAYFAFHGSYAVGPSATDPIGGKLRALRRRAGSLSAFMHIVSHVTNVAELDAALRTTYRVQRQPTPARVSNR